MFDMNFDMSFDYNNPKDVDYKKVKWSRNELLYCYNQAVNPIYNQTRKDARALLPKSFVDSKKVTRYTTKRKKSIRNHVGGRKRMSKKNSTLSIVIYAHTKHYHLLKSGHKFITHKNRGQKYSGDYRYVKWVSPVDWPAKFETLAQGFRDKITSSDFVQKALKGKFLGEAPTPGRTTWPAMDEMDGAAMTDLYRGLVEGNANWSKDYSNFSPRQWLGGDKRGYLNYYSADSEWTEEDGDDRQFFIEDDFKGKGRTVAFQSYNDDIIVKRHLTFAPVVLIDGTADKKGAWKDHRMDADPRWDSDDHSGYAQEWANVVCPVDEDGMALMPVYKDWKTLIVSEALIKKQGANYIVEANSEFDKGFDRRLYHYRTRLDYRRGPKRDPSKPWSREHTMTWRMHLREHKYHSAKVGGKTSATFKGMYWAVDAGFVDQDWYDAMLNERKKYLSSFVQNPKSNSAVNAVIRKYEHLINQRTGG